MLKEEGWCWKSEGFMAKDYFVEYETIMQLVEGGGKLVFSWA